MFNPSHTTTNGQNRQDRSNLVDLMRDHADTKANDLAYRFLLDGESAEACFTFADLDRRARALAAALEREGAAGGRALLVYEPGLDYIAAFFGCLYAGVVAVPAYPLEPLRIHRTLPRLQAIVKDAQAAFVLTTTSIRNWAQNLLAETGDIDAVIATDEIPDDLSEFWRGSDVDAETIAFLQYTSGSTGSPRGVIVRHKSLLHNLAQLDRLDHEGTGGVSWLPPYHDMGLIGGALLPAYRGRPVVLMSPLSFVQRPLRWLQAISRYGVSSSGAPNFGYELCVKKISPEECEGLDLSCWAMAFNGSEPVRHDTQERFYQAFAPFGFRRETFYPCYGLAEATLFVTGGCRASVPRIASFDAAALEENRAVVVDPAENGARKLVGNGRCADDQTVLIVDPETRTECPLGTVGEIWLSGLSVASGYWNRPEETERTFEAFLSDDARGPFMRTGDLGFIHDEELFVTGRLKDLIIVAGRNHYPHDVERTVQNCHDALKRDCGAAFSVEVDGEERVVVVQEVARPRRLDLPALIEQIRVAVAEEHDLNLLAVVLIKSASLPKTTSGKIQHGRCRSLFESDGLQVSAQWRADAGNDSDRQEELRDHVQTPTESQLVELWCEVLGTEKPGPDDNFFDYGGHSLLAMQLMIRIRERFNVELPLRKLFESPTIAGLAAAIDDAGQIAADCHKSTIQQAPVDERRQLSFSQSRLWFLDRLEADAALYNIAVSARLEGELDFDALEQSFEEIVRRHETLRSTFDSVDGIPYQVIAPELTAPIDRVDLRNATDQTRERTLKRFAAENAGTRFNLADGPLLRCKLAQTREREHVLFLAVHHIVADGWSMKVLAEEWAELYESLVQRRSPSLEPLAIQYADYAAWQRSQLDGAEYEKQLDYWTKRLHDAPRLEMPTDRPRPAVQQFRGATETIELSEELTAALVALSRTHDVTLYMTLLATFQTLLARYSSQYDVCVGMPIANRNHKVLEDLIGFFANTLVLRTDLSGDPAFHELLKRVREVTLGAYSNQDLPFEKLVETLRPKRSRSHTPLFQVMLALQEFPARQPTTAGIALRDVNVDYANMTPFELSLYVEQRDSRLRATMAYDRTLFDADTIGRMLAGWHKLLKAAAKRPNARLSDLPVMSDGDRQRMLSDWNQTAHEYPATRRAEELIADQAARTPEEIAVEFDGDTLTYAELDRRADCLAAHLRSLGVGPNTLVGLYVERSLEMVVGLLGVLKAGGAFVPLDPAFPQERLAFMFLDAGFPVVLTQQRLKSTLPEHDGSVVCLDADWTTIETADAPAETSIASPDDLAYVIYTSGSTGKPKGVEIPQRALVNLLYSIMREPGLSADDVSLAVTTLSFDIGVSDVLLPLLVGARLVVARQDATADAAKLARVLDATGATIMQATPATWRMLMDIGWTPAAGFKIFCGGEALDTDLAARLLTGDAILWNLYGPTETTIWSTFHRVTDANAPIPIGRPIANTQVYVLDRHQRPVPIGSTGELYIGGAGVACGYHNRPELTAEKFVADPFKADLAARMYRTGDLVRFQADGTLEYLGRTDHQVKIRGFRIELGEIETVLRAHPSVKDAVVIAREDVPGDRRLAAYYVPSQPGVLGNGQLTAALAKKLPDYMIPSAIVPMDRLPLTPNGKIDRRALPAPANATTNGSARFVEPRCDVERQLVEIFSELLGVPRVSVRDDFFALGGHSMLAVRLMAQIEKRFQKTLPIASLFQQPTIEKLAELIRRPDAAGVQSALIPIQPKGSQRPLFCVHPAGGTVFCYLALKPHLGPDQPIYGLQAQGLDGEAPPHTSVEEMAAHYLRAIRSVQARGPYRLAGWSLGGLVAFEMACQLRDAGETVEILAAFDTMMMKPDAPFEEDDILGMLIEMLPGPDQLPLEKVKQLEPDAQRDYFRKRAESAQLVTPFSNEGRVHRVFEVFQANVQAIFRYRPRRYDGNATLFRATEHVTPMFQGTYLSWEHWVTGQVDLHHVPCEHLQMFHEPYVAELGRALREILGRQSSQANGHRSTQVSTPSFDVYPDNAADGIIA